jgi:glycosyltransferase involved in cell wall biosynthesis
VSQRRAVHHSAELVILNQYYYPDVASTGHLLHELATESARIGRDVEVITCFPCYGPPDSWVACAAHEKVHGVRIRRMRTTRFSKDRIVGRLSNAFTFLVPLLIRQLFSRSRGRVYMYTSNPPFLGIIGGLVSLLRNHRYIVLLHDSYPHLAVWCRKIKPRGVVERVWHIVNRIMYRRACQTIVLCERAKELVVREYGLDPQRVHVIHNWADPGAIRPMPKSESAFARAHGLDRAFTLLYSGNLGLYYEFEALLQLAERFRDDPDFRLVFVGAGGRRSWISAEVQRRGLQNVQMHPYQPFETLNDSLNACDVSLVTIARGIEGISFPSKLYSSLGVGKPILAISERGSELHRMVDHAGAGFWIELGDIDGMVEAVRKLRHDAEMCRHMGQAARRCMDQHYTVTAAAREYLRVVDQASVTAAVWERP